MNLYDVLCVKPTATQDEIKRNFHKAAHVHHPDKGGDAEIFKKISAAYAILSDPNKRAQYNMQIGIAAGFDPAHGNSHTVYATYTTQQGNVSFTWTVFN